MKNFYTMPKKTVQLLITVLLLSMSQYDLKAQALITAAQGGFESGTTFAANGWTEVQTTTSGRKWRVGGLATPYAGNNSAYVGNLSNYNGSNASQKSHFYKDVAIPAVPAGSTAAFSFWLKMPNVEANFDFVRVYRGTSASPVPVGNALPTTGYTQVYSNTSTAYDEWTKIGPFDWTAFAGTTVRIVFTFDNDFATGSPNANPAIDNVELTIAAPTQCASLITPAHGATNIAANGTTTLQWSAPASGPVPTSYDVYCSTSATAPAFVANVTTTSAVVNLLMPATTYYWKIIPKSAGSDPTTCVTRSFTTANPFAPYCHTVTYGSAVEPITSVNFAGINRTSSATLNGSLSLENYTADIANVTTANNYTMTLKGNTDGNYTNYFTVFADWNRDGDFSDAGETYNAGSVVNSTGLDTKTAISTISVPENALAGVTRMRIKKNFNAISNTPCDGGGGWGQSEDYTLNVTACVPTIWYADADGDGFGNIAVSQLKCLQPAGYVANNTDCNDADSTKRSTFLFYVDADQDGYGVGNLVSVCAVNATTPPAGYSLTNNDCNDAMASIHPGVEILYNGIDDNCDGNQDEGFQLTSMMIPTQCGTTLPLISSWIFATNVPGATNYRFEVTNVATNEVQLLEREDRWFALTSLPSHALGSTYSVRIQAQVANIWLGYFGAPCLISTPPAVPPVVPPVVTQVPPDQCGITLPSITTIINTANINNSGIYRFKVTNMTDSSVPNQVQTIDRGLRWFNLTMLPTYNYGTTYKIEVSVQINGVFSPYGSPCMITTPAVAPLTNCNQVVNNSSMVVATQSLNKSTAYRFELKHVGSGAITEIVRPLQWFKFNMINNYIPGALYEVRVAVMTAGNYSPYSPACTITAPGAARFEEIRKVEDVVDFRVIAYPNPTAETFAIDMTASTDDLVDIKIYDMIGKLLDVRTFSAADVNAAKFGAGYPAGVYNIIVTQADRVKVLRVVKR